jgi:type II secretory pathway pseudopilin PulG
MTRRAFTAIELAVVFVLIAVLAIMLLPALEQGRLDAIRAKCLSQVRQIGMAVTMFESDNTDLWPWARVSVAPGHPQWPDPTGSLALLYPRYAPQAYLFRCPATEDLVAFEDDGSDFLNCKDFSMPPVPKPAAAPEAAKLGPCPPSYFYDAGGPGGPGIPRNARTNRVVYGDSCVHSYWKNAEGKQFWLGKQNHDLGGNFLFVDKHVDWLEVSWTGAPWKLGQSMPSVPNPHILRQLVVPGAPDRGPLADPNVFWDDGGSKEYDADLAGMMWFDGSWKEF